MNYDVKNYQIIQTSNLTWAIVYENGPIVDSFNSKKMAQIYANDQIKINQIPFQPAEISPRNLEEATKQYDTSRSEFLTFLQNNPSASSEEKEFYEQKIQASSAKLTEFTQEDTLIRKSTPDYQTYQELSTNQKIDQADQLRQQRASEAIAIRMQGGSASDIELADRRAFEAEDYYQNIANGATNIAGNLLYQNAINPLANTIVSGANNLINNIGSAISTPVNVLNQLSNDIVTVGNYLDKLIPYSNNSKYNNSLTNYDNLGIFNNSSSTSNISISNLGEIFSNSNSSPDHRVRLTLKPNVRSSTLTGVLEPLREIGGILFPYSPVVSYQTNVNYNTLSTVHANQDWYIYQNTPSVQLSITGPFTAQNNAEAEFLIACIHFLRTVTKSRFGESDPNRGFPPPVLLLNGYGDMMFNNLNVIVTNYSVELLNNVDYVQATVNGSVSMIPSLTQLTVSCVVQNTPATNLNFNWDKFANGELMKGGGWL